MPNALDLSIRPTDAAKDASVLSALHTACFPDGWDEGACKVLLDNPVTFGWIGEVKGRPAGFILIHHVGHEAEILSLAVHPTHRRQGIAMALLKTLVTFMHHRQGHKIFLDVSEENTAARALYHELGFKRTGQRENYYRHLANPRAIVLVKEVV